MSVSPNPKKIRDETILECADFLDKEADRLEKDWEVYLASGLAGAATSLHTIPREYARRLRHLR